MALDSWDKRGIVAALLIHAGLAGGFLYARPDAPELPPPLPPLEVSIEDVPLGAYTGAPDAMPDAGAAGAGDIPTPSPDAPASIADEIDMLPIPEAEKEPEKKADEPVTKKIDDSADKKREADAKKKADTDAARKKADAAAKSKADAKAAKQKEADRKAAQDKAEKDKAAKDKAAKDKAAKDKAAKDKAAKDKAAKDKAAAAQVQSSAKVSISRQVRIGNCPSGLDSDKLVTRVTIRLNKDGTLASIVSVTQTGKTASNAPQQKPIEQCTVAAIKAVSRFTGLDPEEYENWKEITLPFAAKR